VVIIDEPQIEKSESKLHLAARFEKIPFTYKKKKSAKLNQLDVRKWWIPS